MLPIPPLASAVIAATQVQRSSEEKAEQVRRAQNRAKDAGNNTDEYVHTVESSDEVTPIHDEDPKQQYKGRKHAKHPNESESDEDGEQHLDLTA